MLHIVSIRDVNTTVTVNTVRPRANVSGHRTLARFVSSWQWALARAMSGHGTLTRVARGTGYSTGCVTHLTSMREVRIVV